MKKVLLLSLSLIIVVTLLALSISPANAAAINSTDIVNISVQIASASMVDINPAAFRWTGCQPGAVCDNASEVEGPNYYALQIENIGSINITHIWFNNTMPAQRPFASGINTTYDAGNFVVLKREGTNAFQFPNRMEYNESKTIVYLRDPNGNLPPDIASFRYGRFRNTSFEYFWMVAPDGNGWCNTTGQTFYIGDDPHTQDLTGSTHFDACSGGLTADPGANGADCRSGSLTNEGQWGVADIRIGNENYCVAVNATCGYAIFSRWNKDGPGEANCGNNYLEYFWDAGGTPGIALVPGNSSIIQIRVHVPYGVMEGYVSQGTLTVLVNTV